MFLNVRGFTFIETLMASIVTAVMAGGTLMSFVLAARIARERNSQRAGEAAGYAIQTVERFRNHVAPTLTLPGWTADVTTWRQDPVWGDNFLPSVATGSLILTTGWNSDALPTPVGGDTESMLLLDGVAARRCYRVSRRPDCNGNGLGGDCLEVRTQVCWKTISARCRCPG